MVVVRSLLVCCGSSPLLWAARKNSVGSSTSYVLWLADYAAGWRCVLFVAYHIPGTYQIYASVWCHVWWNQLQGRFWAPEPLGAHKIN